MSVKHTPGPWHRNVPPATKYPTIFAGRSTHVAKVVSTGIGASEVEANADLLAAAPETLAALERLVSWAETVLEHELTVYTGDHPLAVARAVIAKATGGAP